MFTAEPSRAGVSNLVRTEFSSLARKTQLRLLVMVLGLALRRLEVFYCASSVFVDYQICKWRANQLPPSQSKLVDELWDAAHERNALFLTQRFLHLEGLWVKLGQYLSSRADVMPDAYLKSLSKCQDSLVPRPFHQVKRLVEHELQRPLVAVFHHVDEVPIACASIAQVHRATLKDGREVVIKVQHENVSEAIRQDLANLQTLGDIFKRIDPDFDFSPVIREWAAEVPKG